MKKKMERIAKTKIIATLGPASTSYTVIRKMIRSGLDVARMNFSHGSHKEHLQRIKTVRKINEKYRRHVRLLQDLEGFRIRVGRFKGKKQKVLQKNSTIWLTTEPDTGDPGIIPFDYEGDLKKIGSGQVIFIDDGNIILEAKGSTKKRIKAKVVEGGDLKERKGINMPGVRIPFAGVTPKDKKDMEFGIKHKMDYIAQSFVRTAKDIKTIKRHVKPHLPECRVIAKIESREAIRNIDQIIDASDGIMVARGDMGTAVPIYEIGLIQKMIIEKCNRKKKFVITATQMLEHMTEHSRPVRAEVTDVTNAILDGTDFVMLSEESASGKYPVESVKMMDLIIKFTETYSRRKKQGSPRNR
ncbi:MAG: pyruvate kinase [Candidatus Omnitrophota bacterium]|nr:pyruvate kinase [Candidatus Omnitrophota bacterium]